MILNNFYREFSNLSITNADCNFLNYLKLKYKDQTDIIRTKLPNGNIRIFENYRNFFLKDSQECYIQNPIFKKIQQLCKNTKNHSNLEYIYSRAHIAYIPSSLPFHVDKRSCVLSIPIGGLKYPIYWANENSTILSKLYYSCPVLVNTVIRHGCPENDCDRFLFQIGFNEPFEEIKDLLSTELI